MMRLLQLKTVLVAHDLTAASRAALHTAAALREGGGAAVHLAHVAPEDASSEAQSDALEALSNAAAETPLGRGGGFTPHVLTGSVAESIVLLADRIAADAIITGHSDRPGTSAPRPLGSTAYEIITRALVPCLVVSDPMSIPLHRVLVAIDCSEASRGALLVALSWTSALRDRKGSMPRLTALHVHLDDGTEDTARAKQQVDHELDVLRRAAGDWAGVSVSGITLREHDAVEAIMDKSDALDAELLVLGTRGLSAQRAGELGSVSAAVLARAKRPILLVPPAVWRDHARDMDYL